MHSATSRSFSGRLALVAGVLWATNSGICCGQQVFQQTVQLPTFHYTGVSTTVVVPARGVTPLSTVSRFGSATPFDRIGSRGFGRSASVMQFSVGATIIDNREIDREILAEAARRRGDTVDVLGRPVEPTAQPLQNLRRKDPHSAKNLQRAREAEQTGLKSTAQILYRRVLSQGNTKQRREAAERLAQLARAAAK